MEVRYGRGRLQRRRWRRRHSIIPDMRIQRRGRDGVGAPMPVLMDFKGLHYSATTYTDAALRPRGLFRGRRVTRPVERRQAAVAGEYKSRARQLDRQLHGLTAARQNAGERGPVEVFGTFNEWSSAMHAHARAVAAEASISCWRQLGAATLVETRAGLLTSVYRRWSASVARANAWLRIRRLETMGARGRMAQAYADGADGADHILTGLDLAQLAPDTGGGFGVGLD